MRGRFTRKADKSAHFLSAAALPFLEELTTTRPCSATASKLVGLIDGPLTHSPAQPTPRGSSTLLRLEIGIERLATACCTLLVAPKCLAAPAPCSATPLWSTATTGASPWAFPTPEGKLRTGRVRPSRKAVAARHWPELERLPLARGRSPPCPCGLKAR